MLLMPFIIMFGVGICYFVVIETIRGKKNDFSADSALLNCYFFTPAPALRSKGETVIAADRDAQATEEEIATALENADPSDVIVASSGVVDSAT